MTPSFYVDDEKILATVVIDGTPIKISTSPEFEAFADSVTKLGPAKALRQSLWLKQQSLGLGLGKRRKPSDLQLFGKTYRPWATREAMALLDSLFSQQLEGKHRQAVVALLGIWAKSLYYAALTLDPSPMLSDEEREQR